MGDRTLLKNLLLCGVFSLVALVSKAQLTAQFTASPLSGCAPLLVNFQDQSTGGAAQWSWDLGNGTVSALQNPSVTYFNPGTYTVTLTVQNAAGTASNTIVKQQYITVYALPTVDFTASPLTGCYPLTVNFTDNSIPGSGSITGRLWDFGDGNTSTQQNPSHVYTAAGNYNITLIITNSNGCTKTLTKTNYIVISTGVTAAFTNTTPSGCTVPQTINFQNQSTGTGTLTYQWSFGDGGTSAAFSPSHTYNTAGSFTVQLIVLNSTGCSDTFTVANAINIGAVNADFTVPSPLCAQTFYTFTNTSSPPPVSAAWNFGDGTTSTVMSPVKSYALPGNYTITLVSNFGGCQATVSKNVTVAAKPVSAFTGSPLTSCSAPLTVNFTNNSTGGVSSQWSFGDGGTAAVANPSYTYNASGIYTVTLITTNAAGCTDTLVRTDYIKILPPVASISNLPQQGCAPLTVTFGSTVTGADPVVSYEWDFGDGTTSTAATPTHTFPAGIYDIQLIIITAGGCRDTVLVLQGVKSSVKPTAVFSVNPRDVCAKLPVSYFDLSTGTITDWHWFFGDGSESTQQNPTHVYEDTGLFTIRLIVGNNGCYDTLTFIDYVHIKPPIAIFSVPINCTNHFTKIFTDQSIGADTWNWDFGDGATSTLQNPVHTYAAVGSYVVTLTVFNNVTGCDFVKSQTVIVADERAVFTAAQTQLCKGTTTVFTATSIQAVSAITAYQWDFGDGTASTGNNVGHIYNTAGSYNVRLIITDVNGCKDTLIKNQYIKVYGPLAKFISTVPGSCLMTAVTFTDQTTTDGIHGISQWHWYYGDGIDEILTAPPFQHTYTAAGTYSVSLVVTDSFGCSDSISKPSLLIISTPAANFASADTVSCPGKPIVFSNTSVGPGLTYLWNFGDGATSTQATPTHVYAADGLYNVQLTVTDSYGCVSNLNRPQYIKIASPIANFTVNATSTTCPPLAALFSSSSQNVATLNWDFGDGNTSQVSNPSHIYNIPGTYTAKLTVTSPGGCIAVKTQQMIIQGPGGSFTYAPLAGCSPLVVNFTGVTQPGISFIWDFSDGNTFSTSNSSVSHPYSILGSYVPKMILKDASGCTVPITGIDTIKVTGVVASFTTDTLVRCNSGSVTFTGSAVTNDVITGYLWDFGDGTTSALISPVHFYATTGLYFPKFTITTQSGCSNQVTALLPVRVVKTPDISFTQPPNGCAPLTMNFSGTLINPDTSAVTWKWRFSDGQQFTGQNLPAVLFNNAGIYSDTLVATNSSGCMDTAFNTFEVYAKPTVVASQDITVCQGSGQAISATGAVTYLWSPAAGLSCTNCPSPVASPTILTNYTVTGTSAQGCSNTDIVEVAVQFPPLLQPGPGDTICRGQSAILSVSGAATYVWSPAAGLNTTTGPRVTATPDSSTTYTVIGTDIKSCFTDTASFFIKVYPIPTVYAGANATINVGQSITLTPTFSPDVTGVVWSPTTSIVSTNLPSVTVRPTTDMQYLVRATNAGGCFATSVVNIFVLCNGTNVFIPNTFSPNADGANDIFYVRGTGLFTIKEARIFNRWGEEIFARYSVPANDVTAGWDGTYKGQKLPGDVYVYMIEVLCDNNTTLLYKGNIALVR